MNLDQLYRQKGELTMQIQVAQARLQLVDKQIIDIINKQGATCLTPTLNGQSQSMLTEEKLVS